MHLESRKLNLLSLDGGGIRGLSSLYVLKHMMEAIDPHHPPKPCEVFDMIGGVGSGGHCSFPQGSLNLGRAKFDPQRCAAALRSILAQSGYGENALFRESRPSCRVVIYLTDLKTQKSFSLTSYESRRCPAELSMTATVVEAGQACLASLAGYEPVTMGSGGKRYCDSSRTIVNPVRQVWAEASGLWPGVLESHLGCVVSIGAGSASIKSKGLNEKMGVVRMLTKLDVHDPEREANAFLQEHTKLDDAGRLYRFSVPDGLGDIKVSEVKETELIVDVTKDYLTTELVYKQMRRCVSACVY
ncbi:hypothetical protein CNMCM5793_009208 [Aspergillus hiratsukae]|uniref:PNPLA domain-containing protein n=1 Tax=Aspergillus hiratsukae TaxID=1194566 RepID=A0A8H6P0J9_9EURO|nr:hypothetical protein CNMCM5793_009208 [Aspergillus hiratsukae]KAF7155681.1 hypothetical protein CNMCM6106_005963 [Aspergillus hiratsukae]